MKHERVGLGHDVLEGTQPTKAALPSNEYWPQRENGPMRVVLIPRAEGRAPEPDALAAAGIVLAEEQVDLSRLADNSPLLAEADALVVELDPANAGDMEAFDRLVHLAAGQIAVIAAVVGLGVSDTRALLRLGATDALPIPFTAEELRAAVEPARRVRSPVPKASSAPQRRQGKTLAVLGSMGGVGATSLITQLGVQWASHSSVGLLDFDVQHGSAALLLDIRPSLTLANMIEDSERLDSELFQSVAIRHASGLEIVAGPLEMLPLEAVSTEFVDQAMRMAAGIYDVVLIDLPTAWTEWTVRALQRADMVCMVINLSVPGIFQARRQLELLEANGITPKLKLIANRVQKPLFGRVDLKESESVLGRPIDLTVADDFIGMSRAGNEGRSLKEVGASSRLVKDIKAMVDHLSAALVTEAGHAS